MSKQQPTLPAGRAILFKGPGKPFVSIQQELPTIGNNQMIVKNLYTTLCGSDIHTYCGHRSEPEQVVLGHEIVGEVLWFNPDEEIKDYKGNSVSLGDRIVWSIFSVPAGVEAPREDIPQKSNQLFKYGHALATADDTFNGGLADYCVIRENTAFIKISADMPLKVAATISCAHATVVGALRVAGSVAGKRVLIFGAGLLGISCVSMCREAGAAFIGLIDKDISRLVWGKDFGADETYQSVADGEQWPWPEADIVFDMTGYPDAMQTGLDSLAIGGSAIWIGAVFPAQPVKVNAEKIVRRVLQIKGLHNYNYEDFVNAVAFIENNYEKYPFETLVEREYNLSEVERAFTYASDKKPVRVGITIS